MNILKNRTQPLAKEKQDEIFDIIAAGNLE